MTGFLIGVCIVAALLLLSGIYEARKTNFRTFDERSD